MFIDYLIYFFAVIGAIVICSVIWFLLEEHGGVFWVWVNNFFQVPYYSIKVICSSKAAKRFHKIFKDITVPKHQRGLRFILWLANKRLKKRK